MSTTLIHNVLLFRNSSCLAFFTSLFKKKVVPFPLFLLLQLLISLYLKELIYTVNVDSILPNNSFITY